MERFYEITDSDGNFLLSIKAVNDSVVECVNCEVDGVSLDHKADSKRYSMSMNKCGNRMTREREDVVKELKDKARDRMEHQVKLQNRIYSELGIQVTTCGNCGSVVLVDVNEPYKVWEDGTKLFKCFDCGSVDELCNFPDLYYL